MDPNPAPDHRGARTLQLVLGTVLVAALLVAAWQLLRDLRQAFERLGAEPRHLAAVIGPDGRGGLELEITGETAAALPPLPEVDGAIPSDASHRRVLVPEPPFLWAGFLDEVGLVADPRTPAAVAIVDPLAQWGRPALVLVVALVPALALLGLRRLPWGSDRVWLPGGWRDTTRTPHRPGATAGAETLLRPPPTQHRSLRLFAGLLGALTVATVAGTLVYWDEGPFEAAAPLLPVAVFDLALLAAYLHVRTRRVGWDGAGVCETDFFRTRRFPWSAIASFEHLNLAADEQRRYDTMSLSRRGKRRRPSSVYAWLAKAADGTELLRLDTAYESLPAFATLREEIARRAPAAVRAAAPVADDPFGLGFDPEEAAPAMSTAERAALDRLNARHAQGMRLGGLLMLAPFALAMLWATWSTVSLRWFGERTEGVIVEREGDTTTSVVVEYQPEPGRTLHVRSDGSAAYAELQVGQRIAVFHAADDPGDARIDLFLELWLWPIVAGVLLAIVALPAWLISRPPAPLRPPGPAPRSHG